MIVPQSMLIRPLLLLFILFILLFLLLLLLLTLLRVLLMLPPQLLLLTFEKRKLCGLNHNVTGEAASSIVSSSACSWLDTESLQPPLLLHFVWQASASACACGKGKDEDWGR